LDNWSRNNESGVDLVLTGAGSEIKPNKDPCHDSLRLTQNTERVLRFELSVD